MERTNVVAPAWGRVVSPGGPAASYDAFVPQPVPRELPLDSDTILLLSEADGALSRLPAPVACCPIRICL